MLKIKDENYFKISLKIFIIATSLLLLSFTLSIIFSPSFETFKNISNKKGSNGFEVKMQRSGCKRYGYFDNIDDAVKIRNKWLDEYKSHPKEWIKNTMNENYKEML